MYYYEQISKIYLYSLPSDSTWQLLFSLKIIKWAWQNEITSLYEFLNVFFSSSKFIHEFVCFIKIQRHTKVNTVTFQGKIVGSNSKIPPHTPHIYIAIRPLPPTNLCSSKPRIYKDQSSFSIHSTHQVPGIML